MKKATLNILSVLYLFLIVWFWEYYPVNFEENLYNETIEEKEIEMKMWLNDLVSKLDTNDIISNIKYSFDVFHIF